MSSGFFSRILRGALFYVIGYHLNIEHFGALSYDIKKYPRLREGTGVIMLFQLFRILNKKYKHMSF